MPDGDTPGFFLQSRKRPECRRVPLRRCSPPKHRAGTFRPSSRLRRDRPGRRSVPAALLPTLPVRPRTV